MNREELIIELAIRGYEAEPIETIKNGVVFEGIRIANGKKITPVIYTQSLFKNAERAGNNIGDIALEVIRIYEESKDVHVDIKEILTAAYIYSHIYIGLQRTSDEELVKRESQFEGMEDYLYIECDFDNQKGTIKCTSNIFKSAGVEEAKAWESAMKNIIESSCIYNIETLLSEWADYEREKDDEVPMYVITNRSKNKGAASIYNKKLLADIAQKYKTNKLVVLPSSIHEMIILPYEENMEMGVFNSMVEEINKTKVYEEEQLTNRAYVITV